MTGKSEKQASAPVQTPLHLLQVLTRTLNEHLADACNQAQADAQKVLDKLDQEQQELAAQLEASDKSDDKLQDTSEQLTERMAALTRTRKDAEQYAAQLQSDVRQTLRLAKGLERIDLQVTQSIEKRNSPAPAGTNKRSPARRSRNRKPSAAAPAAESPAKPETKQQKNDPPQ